jgi:oxygen-dependent protoporphyrinogen oxidase
MHTLVSALLADLRDRGVRLLSSTRADTVERTAGGWRVRSGDLDYDAGLLVVAVEGPAAVGLLSGALPELASRRPAAGPDVSLVTLVVNLPELDSAPRGTGILVAPQSPGIAAKALTHATAKWRWLAGQAAPGTHVLRLSYGRGPRPADGSAPEPRTDTELFEAALQDASALLAVPVRAGAVQAWDVVRWSGALPFASLGHKRRVAEVREICAADGTLAVVGGWLSGNGLAAIVADTPKVLRTLLA